MSESRLRELAEQVPGAYPDFVSGIVAFAKEDGLVEEVIGYIEGNPDARTGDIVLFEMNLSGHTEPLPIAD